MLDGDFSFGDSKMGRPNLIFDGERVVYIKRLQRVGRSAILIIPGEALYLWNHPDKVKVYLNEQKQLIVEPYDKDTAD